MQNLSELLKQIENKIKGLIREGKHGCLIIKVNLTSQGGIGDSFIQLPPEKILKNGN